MRSFSSHLFLIWINKGENSYKKEKNTIMKSDPLYYHFSMKINKKQSYEINIY